MPESCGSAMPLARRVPGIENDGALERDGERQDAVEGFAAAVHDEIVVAPAWLRRTKRRPAAVIGFLTDAESGERGEDGAGGPG